jgi:hypothetical protein
MKKTTFLIFFFLVSLTISFASPIKKMQPESWWVGMKNKQLQILIYGDKISDWKINFDYPGVSISDITSTSNPNYLFLYINMIPKQKQE